MSTQVVPISAEHIGNGMFLQKLNETIASIAADSTDPRRKYIAKPRKVTAEITITPELDGFDSANTPGIKWTIKQTVPGIEGAEAKGMVQDGEIVINFLPPTPADEQMKLVSLKE